MVAHSFLPFPSEIIALANGMLYGPLWGSVVTWVGAMLGAVAAVGAVRALGQPVVRKLLPAARHAGLVRWSRQHGGLALLVARLIPMIAFNLINYAAALTEITWWTFLWATGLGILPLTIVLAVLGDNVLDMRPGAGDCCLPRSRQVGPCCTAGGRGGRNRIVDLSQCQSHWRSQD